MTLLQFLTNRASFAKSFTKEFIADVEKSIKDYECSDGDIKKESKTDQHIWMSRYDLPIPYIYSTHESILSSLFEKSPDLVITGKGSQDEDKAEKLRSIYRYLYDKLNLEEFIQRSAWWLILVGFVSSYQEYRVELGEEEPAIGIDGQPLIDEEGNVIMKPTYIYNDPVAVVDDPKKTYFGPESKFSTGAEEVTYIVREKLMDVDEVKAIYGYDVEPDEVIDLVNTDIKSSDDRDDLKRAKVYFYEGKVASDIEVPHNTNVQIDTSKTYYAVFTADKMLHFEVKEKRCSIARWFGVPTKFFGYGLGRTLRTYQKEMSTRRGQQVRYADLYAFPWLMVSTSTQVDQKSMLDVFKRTPLTYNGQPPAYLVPPTTPSTITDADAASRSDAQFVSGTLDLSKGAQETNTVKTATGQQIFAKAADKRVERVRLLLSDYFRQVVIHLFELCKENWDEDKVLTVTDEEGVTQELVVNRSTLEGIDFDADIDIEISGVSVNKETMSQREIELYDKVKDDPLVDRRKVFARMLKKGFNIKNAEEFLLETSNMQDQPTVQPTQVQDTSMQTQDQMLGPELAPRPAGQPYGYTGEADTNAGY